MMKDGLVILLAIALICALLIAWKSPEPVQMECPPIDPAAINAIFEKDMRGEIHLDPESIRFLQSLEPHITWEVNNDQSR